VSSRPLGRSLDPLPGESLNGFLLRLSRRLRLSPVRLARLAGIVKPSGNLWRRLLLDPDAGSFAAFARLSGPEAAALTLIPRAGRYPPIARSLRTSGLRPQTDGWLFAPGTRYCPCCLAGDGSPVQDEPGGCWKLTWQLPVTFACPDHGIPLRQGCPQEHPAVVHDRTLLISQVSDSGLHPAQCRQPRPGAARGRKKQPCGQRLDDQHCVPQPEPAQLVPGALALQERILTMLDSGYPARDAAAYFSDLRVITTMPCITWPASRDFTGTSAQALISQHAGESGARTRPPRHPPAAAGLLTAAASVIEDPDQQAALVQILRDSGDGRPSRTPWAVVLDRHGHSCSQQLREALEPAARSYRRVSGPHSPKAPARRGGHGPEVIPALLEQRWYAKHLARLGCQMPVNMRRAGSVVLVQWAVGGAMGDAARYLGIRTSPSSGQHSSAPELARWFGEHGEDGFTPALHDLAAQLDADAPVLVNYHRRRQAMQDWCLDPGTWQEIADRLPPTPGPFRPIMDDRKRQEASAFTWAHVTQGEPRFAPRPIEASQPEAVRKDWAPRRGNLWHKLARPGRFVHYTELRNLLIEHGDRLAKDIDGSTEADDDRCRIDNTLVTESLPM
jgi:hypothetical protein